MPRIYAPHLPCAACGEADREINSYCRPCFNKRAAESMNRRNQRSDVREAKKNKDHMMKMIVPGRMPAAATDKLRRTDKNFEACFGTDRDGVLLFLGPKPSPDAELDHIIEKSVFIYVVMHEHSLDLPIALKACNHLGNIQWLSKDEHRLKSARDRTIAGREAQRELARQYIRENPSCLLFNRDDFDLTAAHAAPRPITRHV